jgi:hypothetical protein
MNQQRMDVKFTEDTEIGNKDTKKICSIDEIEHSLK